MTQRNYSEVQPSRAWLVAKNGNRTTNFAFPPVRGTHQECYQELAKDTELTPADGIDLALLTEGAYTQNTPQWKSVKSNFRSNWVRTPNRLLWIPKSNELAGILVERDYQGNGVSTKIEIPANVDGWKNDNGIYTSPDGNQRLVSAGSYSLGKVNEKDSFLRAILTNEGAEIFVKTAKDSKLVSYTWGLDISELKNPEKRVSLLCEYDVRLDLGGGWDGDRLNHAFGVSSSREASAPKK